MPHPQQSRLHGKTRPEARADAPDDDVEVNSDDSFPASDAPSWTPVARVGEPKQLPTARDS